MRTLKFEVAISSVRGLRAWEESESLITKIRQTDLLKHHNKKSSKTLNNKKVLLNKIFKSSKLRFIMNRKFLINIIVFFSKSLSKLCFQIFLLALFLKTNTKIDLTYPAFFYHFIYVYAETAR